LNDTHTSPFRDRELKPKTGLGAIPTAAEIAERAHQIWVQQGCPENTAEENWLQAEQELHDALMSARLADISRERGGSVQN
jgi:hypothetical protein